MLADLGIAFGFLATILCVYAAISVFAGPRLLLNYFLTWNLLSFYPHIVVFVGVLVVTSMMPQWVLSSYGAMFVALVSAYTVRRRVVPMYQRYETAWNALCLIHGILATIFVRTGAWPLALLLLPTYCFSVGCLFWVDFDEFSEERAIRDSANDQDERGD